RRTAAQVREIMEANPKIRDVERQWGEKVKSVRLEVDQDRARALGLTTEEVAQTLQALLTGYEVTSLRDGRHSVGVVVRATEAERSQLEDLGNLVLTVRDGRPVPVAQVARVSYTAEEPILWRRSRETVLTVRADVLDGVQAPDV